MLAALLGLIAAASPPGVPAPSAPRLTAPLACPAGMTCAVQQYADHDPGPGAKDYRCGSESYDGHDGTDFRIPDLAALRAGVPVVAAAAGIVRGARDGMDDVSVARVGKAAVKGRECGNGVALTHPGGWETQYCHMRKGSVRVRVGQAVAAGDPLGLVGESGDAEFPHVHLTVRQDGRTVDPFAYGAAPGACSGGVSLWKPGSEPPYRSPAVLNLGFALSPPAADAVEEGLPPLTSATPDAAAIVVYARLINLKVGDRLAVSLLGPDGAVLATQTTAPMDHSKAQYLQFVGKRRTAPWAPGRYGAHVEVFRAGGPAFREERTLTVSPSPHTR